MAAVKRDEPGRRAYLIVVSEAKRPTMFVSEKGVARRGYKSIKGADAIYKVRLVQKASASFKRVDSAIYACLLEVF